VTSPARLGIAAD